MTNIDPILRTGLEPAPTSAPVQQAGNAFATLLRETIGTAAAAETNADRQVQQLHAGGGRNLHEVMLAMEEADISLRLLVSMRNKALEAYQEIMRLQV